jgi:hypothetical protein
MLLEYTLTPRQAKAAGHAAIMATPYPGWRAMRWSMAVLSLFVLLAAVASLLRGADHAASWYFLAAYLCLAAFQFSERMLAGAFRRLPKDSRYRLSLDEHGLSYSTPLGDGIIARTELRYKNTPTAVILYSNARHETVPVPKSALTYAQAIDLLATLATCCSATAA